MRATRGSRAAVHRMSCGRGFRQVFAAGRCIRLRTEQRRILEIPDDTGVRVGEDQQHLFVSGSRSSARSKSRRGPGAVECAVSRACQPVRL